MKRALLFTTLIAWSAMASAVVYKWTDVDGKVHFGDRPPDGVKAEVVEILGARPGTTPSPPPAPSPQAARSPGNAQAGAAGTKASTPAVDPDEAAASKAAQCDAAQARLKQLLDGRHLYKTGENGEREYLTSEQIDAERADAKSEVAQVCGQS